MVEDLSKVGLIPRMEGKQAGPENVEKFGPYAFLLFWRLLFGLGAPIEKR